MIKHLKNNKKAVSPVIATILMIMVVMVGMSIAFSYVVVYSDNYKSGAGSSVLESLTIEDVWVQGNTVQVTVYNAATTTNMGYNVNLQVTAIYIDGAALVNIEGDNKVPNPNPNYDTIKFDMNPSQQSMYNGEVNAGLHVTFQGMYPLGDLAAGTHVVNVATVRGSNFKSSFTTV
ncbi:MAG: archaellin/type IV pilin N-terminal domain-containing protein [Candidatus Bathyarchaeia archaeon]